MPECMVCGGQEFTPHDGFYYCTECQTQSQDLRQQELSFRLNTSYGFLKKTSTKPKLKREKAKRADRLGQGPVWTTWQAFNFMLKGMTEEMIALGAPAELEKVILQVWACYLKVNEVAFVSKNKPLDPKLSFPFRYRDAKVLYDIDTYSKFTAKAEERKLRSKPKIKEAKKYKLRHSAKLMRQSDYQSHLSSVQSQDEMNTTLESLASSSNMETPVKKLKIPRKKHLTKRAAEKQARSANSRYNTQFMLHRPTLLGIIHLSLIITHSQIQLSDLLRFIREGYLSYSVLSHFLPAELKFGHKDGSFVNCDNDAAMPTHHKLRKDLNIFSALLKFRSLPSPDLVQLLKRYASELLLPDQLSDLAVRLMDLRGMPDKIFRSKSRLAIKSFELIAIAPLLVVLKLLFGLDGVTERYSSHFAESLNRLSGSQNQFFSWCQWQGAIECRKAVLTVWHYPTREMLAPETILDAKLGLRFLKNIYKDPHIRERKHKGSAFDESSLTRALERKIEETLEQITTTSEQSPAPTFHPSLTPGITLLQDLISWLKATGQPDPPWLKILAKNWSSFRVDYVIDPEPHAKILLANGNTVNKLPYEWLDKHMARSQWVNDKLDQLSDNQQANQVPVTITTKPDPVKKKRRAKPPYLFERLKEDQFLLKSSHNYWRLLPAEEIAHHEIPWHLDIFETEVMPQFPSSWSWLLTVCSQMLHITARDIYMEVLSMEDDLIQITGSIPNLKT